MGRTRRLMVVATVVVGLSVQALPARAGEYATDAGMGFAAVGIDLFYIPAKVVYATLGGLTGGFAFILTGGRMDTASSIWKPSLGGTYVVTPAMVAGDEPIYFSGPSDDTMVADSRAGAEDEERSRARRLDDEPRPTHRRGEPY